MSDHLDFSAVGPEGMIGYRLFIMTTTPVDGNARDEIKAGALRREHLTYLGGLEEKGLIFAGGPLLGDDDKPSGTGMIVLRADSIEEAAALADGDPMHAEGLRSYSLQGWKVNEGSIQLTATYSGQKLKVG